MVMYKMEKLAVKIIFQIEPKSDLYSSIGSIVNDPCGCVSAAATLCPWCEVRTGLDSVLLGRQTAL